MILGVFPPLHNFSKMMSKYGAKDERIFHGYVPFKIETDFSRQHAEVHYEIVDGRSRLAQPRCWDWVHRISMELVKAFEPETDLLADTYVGLEIYRSVDMGTQLIA